MTPSDAGMFATVLAELGEVYSEAVSPVRARLYFEALSDLTLDEVRAAAVRVVKTSRFFPKPAELLEAIQGSESDHAEQAWALVLRAMEQVGPYQSVDFDDEAIHECVRRIFGGWPDACLMELSDAPFRHAEFLKLYRAVRRRHLIPKPIPGLLEMDNRAKGFLRHIPEPVMLGDAPIRPALPPASKP